MIQNFWKILFLEIKALRQEIVTLRRIILPEISISDEEMSEIKQIHKEMLQGDEISIESLKEE